MFLLKGSKESGFSFEGLGTCIQVSATGCIIVRVVKVLNNQATLPNCNSPLKEGESVTWPQNLVALYRAAAAQGSNVTHGSDGNFNGTVIKSEF